MASEASYSYPNGPSEYGDYGYEPPMMPTYGPQNYAEPAYCERHQGACSTRDMNSGRPRVCQCHCVYLKKQEKRARKEAAAQEAYYKYAMETMAQQEYEMQQHYNQYMQQMQEQTQQYLAPLQQPSYPGGLSDYQTEDGYDTEHYGPQTDYSEATLASSVAPHACNQKYVACKPSCVSHQHPCTVETVSCQPSCVTHYENKSRTDINYYGDGPYRHYTN